MLDRKDHQGTAAFLLVVLQFVIWAQSAVSADQGVPPDDRSFSCADNLVAYRDNGTIVDYLGIDQEGLCLVRYNRPDGSEGVVRHNEWLWPTNKAYPDEGRQIHHDLLFKDTPGQSEVMRLLGGPTLTFTIIDRTDCILKDVRYPCLHYTATLQATYHGAPSGVPGHIWVDPTNGIVLKGYGNPNLTFTVVSLKPMNKHKPITELPR